MEIRLRTFTIKIKRQERQVVMLIGGFASHPDYRIAEDKMLRRPSSYEYQKIYKALKEERKGRDAMPIGQGPEPPTYNPEEEKEQKRLKELDDWWEKLNFSQRKAILGEYEDNETLSREQQYDEEWNDMTLEGREEIYRDWKDIY